MAGLLQSPSRFQALPVGAEDFFLDSEQSSLLYTRAFLLAGNEEENNQNIAGRLQREFSEDRDIAQMVSRWMNLEPISDLEFSGLVLDMHEKLLQRKIAEAAGNIAETSRLGQLATKLKQQRLEIKKQLDEQRRGNE